MVRTLALAVAALLIVSAPASADLTVTFTTSANGGNFAPKNVVAVWIEGPGGAFVKTIGRWAATRKGSLVAWKTAAGTQDADAISGATRANHTPPLTVTWNLLDKAGAVVPDGTYTIRMELADSNASQPAQNHQGTFTFTKGPTPMMQTTSGGGFTAVTIDFAPVGANCNNGVVDMGETCDPPGSCPTTCAASGDACMPNELVGAAATCTAQCMTRAITACANDDGCCAAGCTDATDNDCVAGGGSNGGGGGGGGGGNVEGGCAAGGATQPLSFAGLALLGYLALGQRRRRR